MIIKKTKWKMHLCVPYSARKSFFVKTIMNDNSMINFVFYKNIPVIGGIDSLNTFFLKKNLANPLYKNVLNAGVFLALKMKFSKICIWGADHSWTKDLFVDSQNKVLYGDRHVYDPNIKYIHKEQPLHCLLRAFFLMFKSHNQISKFANTLDSKIYNCSSSSFIDSYERLKE